jgi:small subunit ribosomal protein S20
MKINPRGKMAKETAVKKKTKRPTPEKRNIQNQKKRLMNKSFKSELRTTIRRFEESLDKEDKNEMKGNLHEAYSLLDKAAKRGVLKKNAASRKKSRLAAHFAAKNA